MDTPLKIDSSDFELFGLPVRHALDRADLDARWRDLQARVHPDRYAADGAASQRVAMQWAVRVNEAYRRLKDPLARAAYLCELAGVPIDAERNTAMPAAFLMTQMEWREALDDAKGIEQVEALHRDVMRVRGQWLADVATALDDRGDAAAAAQGVRALMFIERFADDVERRLDALGQ
jgi:molecular chaperone HscB